MEAYEQLMEDLIIEFEFRDKEKLLSILSKYDVVYREKDEGKDLQQKVEMFLAAKRIDGLSKGTIKNYALQLRIFTNYIQKPVEKIKTADIRMYLSQYQGQAANTINNKMVAIRTFFQWLVDEELIARNPAPINKIKPMKLPQRMPKALNLEEVELMREVCKDIREKAMVDVFYSTGCRVSEIYNIDIDDVDFVHQSIRVIGKNNKERTVFFNVKSLIFLKKYLASRKDENPALFVTEDAPHTRLGVRSMQRIFKAIAERAALKKHVHPHIMRHTMATLMFENGADITTVQELLGHTSPATTQIYAQRSEQKKAENYRRFAVQ